MPSELGIARLKRIGIKVTRTEEPSEHSKIISAMIDRIHYIYDIAELKIRATFRYITIEQELIDIQQGLESWREGTNARSHAALRSLDKLRVNELESLIQECCTNILLFSDEAEQKSKWENLLLKSYRLIPKEFRKDTFDIQEGLIIESEEGEEGETILVGPISPEAKSLSGEIQEIETLIEGKREEKNEIMTQISKQDWTNYVRDLKEKFRDNRTRLEEIIHECEEELEICEPHEIYYWQQVLQDTQALHKHIRELIKTTSIPERARMVQSMYNDLVKLEESIPKNIQLSETKSPITPLSFIVAKILHLGHLSELREKAVKLHESENIELLLMITHLEKQYSDYLGEVLELGDIELLVVIDRLKEK